MLGLPWHQCAIPLGKLFFFFFSPGVEKNELKEMGLEA